MIGYSNGIEVKLLKVDLKGCPTLPQWVGAITSSELLEDGSEIYLPDYSLRVYIQNRVRIQDYYQYQVIDKTGFPSQPVVAQNAIYAAGTYYSTIFHDLLDQDIQFGSRMGIRSFSILPLTRGFKKTQLINGLLEEMNFRLYSNETDSTYILEERNYTPIYQVNTYVQESFSNELSPNHFTISSYTGLKTYVFDVEDVNYNGTIYSDPITSYLLFTLEDLVKLGKKQLERSMGLRKSFFLTIKDTDLTDLSTHLGSCWMVNSQLARINAIDISLGKLSIRGYYINEANYASN